MSRLVRSAIAITLAVVAFQATVGSQNEALFVAELNLTLGTHKDAVLQQLRRNYQLTQSGTDDWIIVRKEGAEFIPVGGVAFSGNKLSWISRRWLSSRDSAT